MTIWARKGGKPAGGFLVGGLLGALGVFILAAAIPRQAEIGSAARSAGLTRVPTARSSSKGQARVCRYCQRDVAAPAPGRRTVIAGPKVRHQSAQATPGTQVRRAIAAGAGPAAWHG
jgi:hypothetical protein